ncbi:MAG TPA: hypothetical protein VIY47_11685 [Ignavibacteriaceae bacterium]
MFCTMAMNKLINFYRFLNILSIDVALGAVCCAAWFAQFFDISLRGSELVSLGLTVWMIYTADHLMDAIKIEHEASTSNHRFHQRYFSTLLSALILAVICDGVLMFFIRKEVFHAGVVLLIAVTIYLLFNRSLSFLKEPLVAILYCTGILLPVLSIAGVSMMANALPIVMTFFTTVLINVVLFSWFDYEADKRDGGRSLVILFGLTITKRLLLILFTIQSILILSITYRGVPGSVLFIIMNGLLLLLFIKSDFFRVKENYRLLGDMIFLFPIISFF